MGASSIALGSSIFDILRQTDIKNLRALCDYLAEKLYICTVKLKITKKMEATTTTTTAPKKRISRTARWARAHKWCIEVLDPELQKQCKSYKDGQKIIRP